MFRIVLVLETGIVEGLLVQVVYKSKHLTTAVHAAVNLLKESFPLGIGFVRPVMVAQQGIYRFMYIHAGIIICKSMAAINLNRIGNRVITHNHVPGILHGDYELLLAAL